MSRNQSYDDIRDVEYPVKTNRPRMSLHDRAAQFSPFAALTGFDALVDETARLTDSRIELDDTEKAELDRAMSELLAGPDRKINVTYFLQDSRKTGGAYLSVSGFVQKINQNGKSLVMDGGKTIHLEDIISLRLDE